MLRITNVSKRFGDAVALHNVSLSVRRGELVALLGSSGGGKTTLLRCVAGLAFPERGGSICINDASITDTHPYDRGVEMVFQHLGLFPFLSARENIMRGAEKYAPDGAAEIAAEAAQAAQLSESLLDASIQDLSGGERQRVALARSFAARPHVWLLDEPLSSVDAMLREELRPAILKLHRELNCATVYVTHDRADAFKLADRVGILEGGELVQIGTPEEVYEHPRTLAAARLTGDVNVFETFMFPKVPSGISRGNILGVRPEHVSLKDDGPFEASVLDSRSIAGVVHTHVSLFNSSCLLYTKRRLSPGEQVQVDIDLNELLVFKRGR